jgi:hypothetical protein
MLECSVPQRKLSFDKTAIAVTGPATSINLREGEEEPV